jgi:hypothetical protein
MADRVLAMCGGYGASQVEPFLRSLRRTGCEARVELLLHRCPEGTAAALVDLGAEPVEVALPDVPETFSYNVARWAPLAERLRRGGPDDRVLLCDLRDVEFQADPFEALELVAVHLWEEHPGKPIGACIWTSSWVRYRYGDAALPPIAGRPVLCSGVVAGRAGDVLRFVEQVVAELTPPLRATNYMAGYDQGVVNVLAHGGAIARLVVHPFASAQVLHLGNVPPGQVRLDAQGRVLNERGEVASVVHQRDRHSGTGR